MIEVVAAIGTGQTLLSAFDAALFRCGAHDRNLIPLSSVIPPGAAVAVADRYAASRGEFGDKQYVVMAEARSAMPGAILTAGVGWLQWGDGRGVFVEHEAESTAVPCDAIEAALARQIRLSLRDLAARRQVPFTEERLGSRIISARVDRQPTCALVLAVYQQEGWR
jgi:arginine decarboxylase